MNRFYKATLWLVFAIGITSPAMAQRIELTLDVDNRSRSFEVGPLAQGETTTIRANLRQGGSGFTNVVDKAELYYYDRLNPLSGSAVIIESDVENAAGGYVEFNLEQAETNTNGTFYAEIVVTMPDTTEHRFGKGRLRIEKSQIANGAAPLLFKTAIDWSDIDQYSGDASGVGQGPIDWANAVGITVTTNSFGQGDQQP